MVTHLLVTGQAHVASLRCNAMCSMAISAAVVRLDSVRAGSGGVARLARGTHRGMGSMALDAVGMRSGSACHGSRLGSVALATERCSAYGGLMRVVATLAAVTCAQLFLRRRCVAVGTGLRRLVRVARVAAAALLMFFRAPEVCRSYHGAVTRDAIRAALGLAVGSMTACAVRMLS
jgi:hypothetical protein